jgi:hypothetical protein
MENLPNLEQERETLNRLRRYLKDGMLLHGSKVLVEKLEPRQASDNNKEREIGKAFAIYAETEDVRIPILMALFDKKDQTLADCRTSYSAHGPDEPIIVSGDNYTFSPGYVYALPPEKFSVEQSSTEQEHIATEPITPIAVFKVNPLILSLFDDIEINLN